MNLNLKDKTALVCGSSQGIGLGAAVELSNLGASVVLFARSAERLEKAQLQLDTDDGQQHRFLVADFSEPAQIKMVIEPWLCEGNQVDILVNNTGGPPPGPASEAKPNDFLEAFHLHVISNQILTRAVVPHMKSKSWGRIINIISTSVKQPLPNLGVSNTIRGAVANWSKTLAKELGPFGITVNNVLPGATLTGRLQDYFEFTAQQLGISSDELAEQRKASIPVGRFAEPEEVGAAVAFLASPAAAYINGINLPVDGGALNCL